ncbi:flagellar biosynthetic protein FliR [bacterium DOLZORAL124_64_63]|nr:MAG: flagellar biosynthetic protein FliR [bacterium DOLZORAL124_64_63]
MTLDQLLLSLRIAPETVQLFFLILVRMAGVITALPPMDMRGVPAMAKVGLTMGLTLMVYPLLSGNPPPPASGTVALGLMVLIEAGLGLFYGLFIRLLFAGVQLAGQLAGFQMGFAIVNVMDPVSSSQMSITGQILNIFSLLAFVMLDMHHAVIRVVVLGFSIAPPGTWSPGPGAAALMNAAGAEMFTTALKIGAPVIAALLLTSVAFGLMARTVPQMNIFFVAMPMKILVGLFFMALSLTYFWPALDPLFYGMIRRMLRLSAG